MNLNSKLARVVRYMTRRAPPLYRVLARAHHALVGVRERQLLRRAFGPIECVRYSRAQLRRQRADGFRSQFGQDHYLLERGLVPETDGRFIEIGCNHPEQDSNSWYLERHCAYAGLAMDPLARFAGAWAMQRPATVFIQAFVSARAGTVAFAEVSGEHGWESMLSGAADTVNVAGKNVRLAVRELAPRALREILQEQGWSFGVDILFVDVEGHEAEVLDSADWSGEIPALIVIENTGPWASQQALRQRITKFGYRLLARISIYDDVYQRSQGEDGRS